MHGNNNGSKNKTKKREKMTERKKPEENFLSCFVFVFIRSDKWQNRPFK